MWLQLTYQTLHTIKLFTFRFVISLRFWARLHRCWSLHIIMFHLHVTWKHICAFTLYAVTVLMQWSLLRACQVKPGNIPQHVFPHIVIKHSRICAETAFSKNRKALSMLNKMLKLELECWSRLEGVDKPSSGWIPCQPSWNKDKKKRFLLFFVF